MNRQSPVDSYHELKRRYPDTIMLFRIGDFCEFFGEDATKVSAILGLTITTRKERGKPELPMAGFPYQSIDRNLVRLVQSGNRVAVVEQKPEGKSDVKDEDSSVSDDSSQRVIRANVAGRSQ